MPTQIITETLPPLAWVDWALPLAALVVIVVAGGIGLYAEWRKENGK